MHVALTVSIQVETFGGKLFNGIFCNSKNAFFDITCKFYEIPFCQTAREVKEFREPSKNVIKRVGHRTSFSDNRQKLKFGGYFLWTFNVAKVTAMTSQSALKYCPTKEVLRC